MTTPELIEPDESNPELMPVVKSERQADIVKLADRATPQLMRVMEVNEALLPAYQKAATLELTEAEIADIQAPFPDEVVEIRPHDGLLYIPHIHISNRFNRVFKPGKWALICRRHWLEGTTMYGEYVLVVRGCYVGESVGGHPYQPNNPKVNYSDTLESTAAEALRRIAGKRLSCGSQVWEPEYCRQWCEKHSRQANGKYFRQFAAPTKPAPKPAPMGCTEAEIKAATKPTPEKPKGRADATPEQKAKMVKLFESEGPDAVQAALGYFIDVGAILPTETLEAVPLRFVPTTQGEMRELAGLIAVCNMEGKSTRPSWAADPGRVNVVNPKPIDATKPLVLPDGMEEEVGELQQVTVKEGKSAKGPWVLYGLLVNDKWHNSFSNTIGKAAQGAKGQEVRVVYLQTPKGRTVHDLVIDGFSVENPPQ